MLNAHSILRQHKTAQYVCTMEHLVQAVNRGSATLCAWAPQHANSVSSLPYNTQILAGRLTVLAMFCPLNDCSFQGNGCHRIQQPLMHHFQLAETPHCVAQSLRAYTAVDHIAVR